MRLLVATANRFLMGGADNYVRAALPALAGRGHQVALMYEVSAPPSAPTVDGAVSGVPAWPAAGRDRDCALQHLSEWKPDVIFSHGIVDADLENLITRQYPTVLFAHNYYGTCASGRKCHTFPSGRPCSRTFGPACLAMNYLRGCGIRSPLRLLREYRTQAKRRSHFSRYRAVLVASRHMHTEYARHGVSERRLHYVPLPNLSVPDSAPPVRRPLSNGILFMGRLTRVKGGEILIDAISRAAVSLGKRLELVVAGDGPEKAALQARATARDVPVEFLGWVDSARLNSAKRRADILAAPSLWPEPFGLVGIEAGSVGLPAVGFATGGITDWLIPGKTGESAPADPSTAAGLADAIVRALHDPEHHHRLRVGAWQMARTFTLERHLDLLEPILAAAARG